MREHVSDDELQRWSERVAIPLRAQERLAPDFESRLMTAVRENASRPQSLDIPRSMDIPRRAGLRGRWFAPLAGVAVAASLVGAVIVGYAIALRGVHTAAREVASVAPATPAHDTVYITRFVLVAPRAASVSVVGDFNAWDTTATRLANVRDGVWSVSLPLTPGRHEYAFVIDGRRWTVDPAAPATHDDEFGVRSSVITVGPSST